MHVIRRGRTFRSTAASHRPGVSSLDYVLAIGIVLPLLAFVLPTGRRMMILVYELTTTLVSWPFM